MCRVEFLKIGKRDFTFIREMRVCIPIIKVIKAKEAAGPKKKGLIKYSLEYKFFLLPNFAIHEFLPFYL